MKYETTFSEMSSIFALVATAEEKVEKYIFSETVYSEKCDAYNKSGYNIEKGHEMCDAYDSMEKARKGMRNSFKKLIAAFGVYDTDERFRSYEDQNLMDLAKRDYEPYRFLGAAKREAVRLAKYITI